MGSGDCARVTAQTERHFTVGYPVFWQKYQHVQADSCSEDYRPFERLEIEFIRRFGFSPRPVFVCLISCIAGFDFQSFAKLTLDRHRIRGTTRPSRRWFHQAEEQASSRAASALL